MSEMMKKASERAQEKTLLIDFTLSPVKWILAERFWGYTNIQTLNSWRRNFGWLIVDSLLSVT